MAKSNFGIFKRQCTLAGFSNSFIIEHGAKLENAKQITQYPLNSLFLLPHDRIQSRGRLYPYDTIAKGGPFG
jgi:hypothetical protein